MATCLRRGILLGSAALAMTSAAVAGGKSPVMPAGAASSPLYAGEMHTGRSTLRLRDGTELHFTADLRKMDVPTLCLHGDADQIVALAVASARTVKIAPKATLKVYPGAPHGMCVTHADRVNSDLLEFILG